MRRARRDSYLWGFIAGAVVPFVGYAVFLLIFDELDTAGVIEAKNFSPTFRGRTLLLVAICLNLIPMHIFRRRNAYNSMRGVVLPTMGYCIYWLLKFSGIL